MLNSSSSTPVKATDLSRKRIITGCINVANHIVFKYVYNVTSYDNVKVYKNGELVMSESETRKITPASITRQITHRRTRQQKQKQVVDLTLA